MKKDNILWILVILSLIVLVILSFFVYIENQNRNILLFGEITSLSVGESKEQTCKRICNDRGYDGWIGYFSIVVSSNPSSNEISCECYKLIEKVDLSCVDNCKNQEYDFENRYNCIQTCLN